MSLFGMRQPEEIARKASFKTYSAAFFATNLSNAMKFD